MQRKHCFRKLTNTTGSWLTFFLSLSLSVFRHIRWNVFSATYFWGKYVFHAKFMFVHHAKFWWKTYSTKFRLLKICCRKIYYLSSGTSIDSKILIGFWAAETYFTYGKRPDFKYALNWVLSLLYTTNTVQWLRKIWHKLCGWLTIEFEFRQHGPMWLFNLITQSQYNSHLISIQR